MHQQPSPARTDDDAIEQAVLGLLTNPGPGVWALEDLVREISDPLAATDAVRRLRASGLVHVVADTAVFASRAAIRSRDLW